MDRYVFFPGAIHDGSKVGIYACDPEVYTDPKFADLFKCVIQDYHTGDATGNVKHPEPSFGTDEQIASLGDLDPSQYFVKSTRVRLARSHKRMPFPPAAKKEVSNYFKHIVLVTTRFLHCQPALKCSSLKCFNNK